MAKKTRKAEPQVDTWGRQLGRFQRPKALRELRTLCDWRNFALALRTRYTVLRLDLALEEERGRLDRLTFANELGALQRAKTK